MEYNDFKIDCEAVNVDVERIKELFGTSALKDRLSFSQQILGCVNSQEVLFCSFVWEETKEGGVYWDKKHEQLCL